MTTTRLRAAASAVVIRHLARSDSHRLGLVVDSATTARATSGELLVAIAEGALGADAPLRELGDVVAGRAPGRTGPDEITVFDSVGLGALDLAVAAAVIDLARRRGVGTSVRVSLGPR